MVEIIFVHVLGDLFWIGSIVAVALILRGPAVDAKTRGVLAMRVYRSVATPAFGVAFLAGATLLALHPHFYFVDTHYMHPKLTLALGVIALHHILGAHAKRMAAGGPDTGGTAGIFAICIAIAAAGAAFFGVVKPF